MITKCCILRIGLQKYFINPTRSIIYTTRNNCPKSSGSTDGNEAEPMKKPRAEVFAEQRELYVQRNGLYKVTHNVIHTV